MTRAFAYLRVSGKGQIDGDGFTRQLAAIQKYAKANEIQIAKVFREEGVSGTAEGVDRVAWVEMIAQVMRNGHETIMIEKLDRLGRDLMVQEHIIADLRKRGIVLISAYEPDLCVDDPTRKLLRQIMGAISEYDKTMLVLKMRGARERIRARGERCEGAKRYGEYPGEVAILGRIRQLRAGGMTLHSIAALLNEQAVTPRRGREWYASSVRSVLRATADAPRAGSPPWR